MPPYSCRNYPAVPAFDDGAPVAFMDGDCAFDMSDARRPTSSLLEVPNNRLFSKYFGAKPSPSARARSGLAGRMSLLRLYSLF